MPDDSIRTLAAVLAFAFTAQPLAQTPASTTSYTEPTEEEARVMCEREAVNRNFPEADKELRSAFVERCIRVKTFRRRLDDSKRQSEASAKANEEARDSEQRELEEKAAAETKAAAEWARRPATVRIGMTKAQVERTQWGKPDTVNSTVTRHGTHEQWVFGGGQYLYFENGILTSIQTSR